MLRALMTTTIILLAYGLLLGKSANDYNTFFEKILGQDDIRPKSILVDFEIGIITSVKDMLPNILHKGIILVVIDLL